MSRRSGTARSELENWVEAALFIAGKRLSLKELEDLLDCSREELISALEKLSSKYRGPIVVEFNDSHAVMRVQDRYLEKLWMLGKGELSKAELKTLAIIAYYAPVKQSDVVRIRGNRAYEHVRKLEEMGLIRTEKQGATKVIYLAQGFYDYFGEEIVERIRGSKVGLGERAEGGEGGENLEER